ncbi:MAG: hypothetical protein HOP09_01925 [Hyphomicrobium sp.]|nr:hypothetical protein [Hyphomicrobium sp.]
MFSVSKRPQLRQRIDLASVRDTLLYLESDLAGAPGLERIANAISDALAEIDRMELSAAPFEAPAVTQARFLPAGL